MDKVFKDMDADPNDLKTFWNNCLECFFGTYRADMLLGSRDTYL